MSVENPSSDRPISSDQPEVHPERMERQKEWEEKRVEVNSITDRLNDGIDEGIKEPIIALRVHDFPTSASCGGHEQEQGVESHGLPYPWIDISTEEPEGWQQSEEIQEEWKNANEKQRQRMKNALNQFYSQKQSPADSQLILEDMGTLGAFRIQSTGAEEQYNRTQEQQREKLREYRMEMDNFAQFLKEKHFEKQ